MQRGYAEGVCGGDMWRGYVVRGMERCVEGCAEVVAPSNHRFSG